MMILPPPPASANPAVVYRVMGDAEFRSWANAQLAALEAECEYRPTAGPEFVPTAEDDAERLSLELEAARLEAESEQHEYNLWLDRLHAERMTEVFGGPDMTWHPAELAGAKSCCGHPASEG